MTGAVWLVVADSDGVHISLWLRNSKSRRTIQLMWFGPFTPHAALASRHTLASAPICVGAPRPAGCALNRRQPGVSRDRPAVSCDGGHSQHAPPRGRGLGRSSPRNDKWGSSEVDGTLAARVYINSCCLFYAQLEREVTEWGACVGALAGSCSGKCWRCAMCVHVARYGRSSHSAAAKGTASLTARAPSSTRTCLGAPPFDPWRASHVVFDPRGDV